MKMSSGYYHRAPVIIGVLLALVMVTALTAAGCGPVLDPEEPVFHINVDLPIGEKSAAVELKVRPETQAVVPLTIVSAREEPIEISLSISHQEEFPEAITVTVPEDAFFLPGGENVTVGIVYNVGESVVPGRYHMHVIGTLSEQVEGILGKARAIDIIVTDKPQAINTYSP